MARYMIRLVNSGYRPEDSRLILSKASMVIAYAGLDTGAEVRDARVASRHLELDVSAEPSMLDTLLQGLGGIAPVLGYTEIRERIMGRDERILHARELFNAERYWEAHEVLEGVWRESNGDEKELIQGIILVCAALVHAQKAERGVCLSILARALQKMQGREDRYHGIDIDVVGMVKRIMAALDSGDPTPLLEYRM